MVKEIFHIFILFMIMTFIVIFNESSIVFDIEFYKNNINVLISLANLIIMIIYVWCTKKIMDENINTNKNILEQIKLQEIQFKKASFVQHESEVLIKFKNAILDADNSFHFFIDLLRDKTIVSIGDSSINPPYDITYSELMDNYEKIYNIHDIYKRNVAIFSKHNLSEFITYIEAFLASCSFLSGDDLTFRQISHHENSKTFQHQEQHGLALCFAVYIYTKRTKNFENFQRKAVANLNKYIDNFMTIKIKSLIYIDNETIYSESKVEYPSILNSFPSPEFYRKRHINKR